MDTSKLNAWDLIAGLVFGAVGLYYFKIAKKDANFMGILFAIALMGYSWFMPNPWANWGVGFALSFFGYKALQNN